MTGSPSESEIQTQWQNSVDLLESTRNYADGTVAGAGNLLDVLEQSLEGDYTTPEIGGASLRYRAALATLVEPGRVLEFLTPLLFEYAKVLGYGSGYRDPGSIMRALYEDFATNSKTVQSRAITYDTTATAGGSNVGNGAMSRLTVDENAFNLESCHVETKRFRCRADQNTGTEENAESFEHLGDAASYDSLLRSSFGSGEQARTIIRSHHAGGGSGGSLLRNSSFSTFSSSATPKFVSWTESAGGGQIAQDTTNFYRTHPGTQTDASLEITGGGGTVTLKQTIRNMKISRLDPDTPYFYRVMLNKTVGSASGGTVTIRLGSQTNSVTIAALGSGWQELLIGPGQANWPRAFNEDPFDVEIEWSSSSSGTLLVDDVLFAPWDLIDGTYWFLRGNASSHTPWLVDDTLAFTDTGGAPATGKIQWWLFVSGLGYLPSSGTPTFADP